MKTFLTVCVVLSAWIQVQAATFPFQPARDEFKDDALLDLRWLNEKEAGSSGWLKIDKQGDFINGKGDPIRIWAVNTGVTRGAYRDRPLWKKGEDNLERHARWLAKMGVNMVRCHSHLNPSDKQNNLIGVNKSECDWIWRTVATMKKEGIYTTVSPYWARGELQALVFFHPEVQKAYKGWLKHLFTTKTDILGGKTLAEEPALGIFQIQNEDSFLFWTINNLKGENRKMLGRQLGEWATKKYGSLDKAMQAWGGHREPQDDLGNGVLDLVNIWNATKGAKDQNNKQTPRVTDQMQFFTELMYKFNKDIGDYVRKELKCPVVINAGNWKTADTVLLNDLERYSYTANEVIAVNRYFGGIHNGEHRGWAIVNGDVYSNDSALTNAALSMPLNLKQVQGKPMMITESSWVMPNEYAAESPFLVSVYSSLTGFDAYYWFNIGTESWVQPRSANGFLPSQAKWICLTPDMAGQFPGAALAFRQQYIKRGEPVLVEHRSLDAMYQRKSPMIAETASFDPNRDAGDQPADSKFKAGVSPYAFLAGPVEVVYDSSESKTTVVDLNNLIKDSGSGKEITSITGEIVMNTESGFCTVNTAKCQGVTAHFKNKDSFAFADVNITCTNDFGTVMVVSYDGKDLSKSEKVLVQVGMQSRPTGWKTVDESIKQKNGPAVAGKKIIDYGKAPWQVVSPQVTVSIKNKKVKQAHVLNAAGEIRETIELKSAKGAKEFSFPSDALYVMLTP